VVLHRVNSMGQCVDRTGQCVSAAGQCVGSTGQAVSSPISGEQAVGIAGQLVLSVSHEVAAPEHDVWAVPSGQTVAACCWQAVATAGHLVASTGQSV